MVLALLYLLVVLIMAALAGKLANPAAQEISLNSSSPAPDEILYKNTATDPVWGNPSAPVKIIEFSDFQCPFCQESFPIVREMLFKYQDKIYFIYRDFPNNLDHPQAQKAAEAGQCANEQGKFWPLHDKFFINQDDLSVAAIKNYAQAVGLDSAKFNVCLDSGKYAEEVNQDYQDGASLGALGTPTFFINGYKVSGVIPKETFIKIIDLALSATTTKP